MSSKQEQQPRAGGRRRLERQPGLPVSAHACWLMSACSCRQLEHGRCSMAWMIASKAVEQQQTRSQQVLYPPRTPYPVPYPGGVTRSITPGAGSLERAARSGQPGAGSLERAAWSGQPRAGSLERAA
ncbi:hypothetical protein QJQ45_023748 [Haematococcus lacustris]|nr:hypothetical protein QJQ45_023748 [Haematococcus lacustris]